MRVHKIFYLALLAVILAGCNSNVVKQEETPTDVLKKFVEASNKKDVEAVKQTLSSGTLRMLGDAARKQNITLEESLTRDGGKTLQETPETRNEKIEGETATVEVKNAVTSDWDAIPFVREEGKWKIAFDKFMDELLRKSNGETKMPATNNSVAPPPPPASPPAASQNLKR